MTKDIRTGIQYTTTNDGKTSRRVVKMPRTHAAFLTVLQNLYACITAQAWVKNTKATLKTAWQTSGRSDWMVWWLRRVNVRSGDAAYKVYLNSLSGDSAAEIRARWNYDGTKKEKAHVRKSGNARRTHAANRNAGQKRVRSARSTGRRKNVVRRRARARG